MIARRAGSSPGSRRRRGWRWALFTVGFLLSPLTPWNDAWVNIPLSVLFAPAVQAVARVGLLPALLLSYLFTNVLGIVLMGLALLPPPRSRSRDPGPDAAVIPLPPRGRRDCPEDRSGDHRRAA